MEKLHCTLLFRDPGSHQQVSLPTSWALDYSTPAEERGEQGTVGRSSVSQVWMQKTSLLGTVQWASIGQKCPLSVEEAGKAACAQMEKEVELVEGGVTSMLLTDSQNCFCQGDF